MFEEFKKLPFDDRFKKLPTGYDERYLPIITIHPNYDRTIALRGGARRPWFWGLGNYLTGIFL